MSDTPTDLACKGAPLGDSILFASPSRRGQAQRLADTYCRHCPRRDWCAGEQQRLASPGVWAGKWWKPSPENRGCSEAKPIDLLGGTA